MESQPQNPEFRINPEKLHPCLYCVNVAFPGQAHLLFSMSPESHLLTMHL